MKYVHHQTILQKKTFGIVKFIQNLFSITVRIMKHKLMLYSIQSWEHETHLHAIQYNSEEHETQIYTIHGLQLGT